MRCLYLFVVSNSDCAMSFGDDRVIIIVYFGFVIFYFRTLCNTKTRTKSSFSLGSTSILNKTELQFCSEFFWTKLNFNFVLVFWWFFRSLSGTKTKTKNSFSFVFVFAMTRDSLTLLHPLPKSSRIVRSLLWITHVYQLVCLIKYYRYHVCATLTARSAITGKRLARCLVLVKQDQNESQIFSGSFYS